MTVHVGYVVLAQMRNQEHGSMFNPSTGIGSGHSFISFINLFVDITVSQQHGI